MEPENLKKLSSRTKGCRPRLRAATQHSRAGLDPRGGLRAEGGLKFTDPSGRGTFPRWGVAISTATPVGSGNLGDSEKTFYTATPVGDENFRTDLSEQI